MARSSRPISAKPLGPILIRRCKPLTRFRRATDRQQTSIDMNRLLSGWWTFHITDNLLQSKIAMNRRPQFDVFYFAFVIGSISSGPSFRAMLTRVLTG
jgi:hypothetical protein